MTEPEHEPTMNERLRLKPRQRDIFAKYRKDPEQTPNTDPKDTDQ